MGASNGPQELKISLAENHFGAGERCAVTLHSLSEPWWANEQRISRESMRAGAGTSPAFATAPARGATEIGGKKAPIANWSTHESGRSRKLRSDSPNAVSAVISKSAFGPPGGLPCQEL